MLHGLDLRRLGYRLADIFGVCALNLFLMPVCLSGVLDSIRQAIMRKRGRFVRTPKIGSGTVLRPAYILFNAGVAILMAHYAADALMKAGHRGTVMPTVNLSLYLYGFVDFLGFQAAFGDRWLAIKNRLTLRLRPLTAP